MPDRRNYAILYIIMLQNRGVCRKTFMKYYVNIIGLLSFLLSIQFNHFTFTNLQFRLTNIIGLIS